jgi:hypothetical protein
MATLKTILGGSEWRRILVLYAMIVLYSFGFWICYPYWSKACEQ